MCVCVCVCVCVCSKTIKNYDKDWHVKHFLYDQEKYMLD